MLVRILAYFVPFAINFLNGGFFFISAHRFAEAKCSGVIIGSSIAAWGISYCLVTMLIGRVVKLANALALILSGGVVLSLVSVGFIVFDGIYTQFVWLILSGIGAALFCTPFQIFAKSIEDGSHSSGTVSATAFYTLTWSLGFASGPLAFARLSIRQGFVITLILALAVTASVALIALLRREKSEKKADLPPQSQLPEKSLQLPKFTLKTFTKLAILGWIVGGLGTVTVSQLRVMWPKLGEELALSRDHIAYVMALVSFVQGFTALALCRSKNWMWKRLPALLMSFCGIISLLGFAFAVRLSEYQWWGLPGFYLLALTYGIYSGCLYFYLVYHSLAHPERSSFFVAGNEIIVGVTSMLSPLIGGLLVDFFNFTGAAFIFGALVTLLALSAQLILLAPSGLTEEK